MACPVTRRRASRRSSTIPTTCSAVYGDAQYALDRLATLHRELENPALLIAPFVHREAAVSSQVEGTNVTISDIYAHEVGATPERAAADEPT